MMQRYSSLGESSPNPSVALEGTLEKADAIISACEILLSTYENTPNIKKLGDLITRYEGQSITVRDLLFQIQLYWKWR